MIRAALLAFLVALPAAAAPDYGLIRNFTGHGLAFPLQIRTDPGRDMLVTLRDAETGQPALTAHLEGGAFFRVLVPAGIFTLDLLAGARWRDDDPPFGPNAERISLDRPLTFRVTGPARKSGHLVDLRGGGEPSVRPIGLCQTYKYDPRDIDVLRDYYDLPYDDPDRPDIPPGREVRERLCD